MKTSWKKMFFAAAFLALASGPALAQSLSAGTSAGIGAGASASGTGISAGTNANVGISATDRSTLNNYVNELPSGARSSTGGQFRVGESLPEDAATSALPANVTNRLQPMPSGFSYVQAGSDIYLINNQNRRIVDRVGIR